MFKQKSRVFDNYMGYEITLLFLSIFEYFYNISKRPGMGSSPFWFFRIGSPYRYEGLKKD